MQPTFAAMLMGQITMPPLPSKLPKGALIPVSADRLIAKTWGDGLNSDAMAEYRASQALLAKANRQKLIDAMLSGIVIRLELVEETGLSLTTIQRLLQEMLDAGEVAKKRISSNHYEWRLTSPHSYSTGNRHQTAPGNDCNPQGGVAVFDGEGV